MSGTSSSKAFEAQPRTCFASTACVNSGEKATCVIETSSNTRLNRSARRVRFSRTSRDTYRTRSIVNKASRNQGRLKRGTNLLTLSDNLAGVKLRHHAFEDLVHNGRQDTFIIVGAQLAVNSRKR